MTDIVFVRHGIVISAPLTLLVMSIVILQNLLCKTSTFFGIPAIFQISKLGLGESKYNVQLEALN